jgi:hypothetical protein
MSEQNLNDLEAEASAIDPPQNNPEGGTSLSALDGEAPAIDPPQNTGE